MRWIKLFEDFHNDPFHRVLNKEMDDTRRFYLQDIPSVIGHVMNRLKLAEVTDDMASSFVDTINDRVFGGVEPEEWPEHWYDFWDNFNKSYFFMGNQEDRKKLNPDAWKILGGYSPYVDKSVPYISWSKEMDDKLNNEWKDIKTILLYVNY